MILLFFIGLAVGSFVNVVVVRLNEPAFAKATDGLAGFFKGRSKCPRCKKEIAWFDNIPLLSFVGLRGKCRFCRKPIHWQYPLVELAVGLAFALSGNLIIALMATLLIALFISDLRYMTLPEVFSAPLLVLTVIDKYSNTTNISNYILAGAGAALFFLVIWGVTRGRGMGFGDVEYGLIMGMMLGWPRILVGLAAAFILGAAVGVALLAMGKKKLSGKIAFGPFLILGTVIAIVWGAEIAYNYLGL